MKTRFNKTTAKDIADSSFGLVLDCILGYSDSGYNLSTDSDEFEGIFEGEMEYKNITITDKRIKLIAEYYDKMREDFINKTRKKYY